jgi:cobaltochelatase CobN
VSRAARWQQLQAKARADKRLAIIYYNHPPGRQNIGADNLDVPASLFGILQRLKAEGYDTGELPASPEALLDRIMAHGVNLPEDKTALRELAREVAGLSAADYRRWFAGLPERVQGEMVSGPLGRLHAEVLEAERTGERSLGRKRVESAMKELHHLAEGADHPGGPRPSPG